MGTRSMTIFMDGDQELARLYRQYDGYPEGHGCDLARAVNKRLVNGYTMEQEKDGGYANGMGNLAVQAIAKLADGIRQYHLEPTRGDINNWVEYVYLVRGAEGNFPTIECTTQTGPFPNVQPNAGQVFIGSPQEWLAVYAKT